MPTDGGVRETPSRAGFAWIEAAEREGSPILIGVFDPTVATERSGW